MDFITRMRTNPRAEFNLDYHGFSIILQGGKPTDHWMKRLMRLKRMTAEEQEVYISELSKIIGHSACMLTADGAISYMNDMRSFFKYINLPADIEEVSHDEAFHYYFRMYKKITDGGNNMTNKYDKLVRNNIPQIIMNSDQSALIRKCRTSELPDYLFRKFDEEVREFNESHSVEELADVLEVVYAIAEEVLGGIKLLEDTRKEKVAKRGSFSDHIILIETSDID